MKKACCKLYTDTSVQEGLRMQRRYADVLTNRGVQRVYAAISFSSGMPFVSRISTPTRRGLPHILH